MKLTHLIAACATLVAAGTASAVAVPGQDLGPLSPLPALYGSFTSPSASTSFLDSFTFSLAAASDVIGSVGQQFGGVTFNKVWIDGASITPVTTPTGYGFSFAGIGAGNHTLKIDGTLAAGFNGYVGSVYATPAVPEPTSVALVLAGLGVAGLVARRRAE